MASTAPIPAAAAPAPTPTAFVSGVTAAPEAKPRGHREVQNITHPKFIPTYLSRTTTCPLSTESETWITPLRSRAYFPLDIFHRVLDEMAHHPEQNSGLILRAEPLEDPEDPADAEVAERLGLDLLSHSRVRFIPRQPRRDSRLDQRIVAYSSPNGDKGIVLKTPLADSAATVPFYHPPVRRLAFLWDTEGADDEVPSEGERCYGTITVAYLPFPDTACGTEFLAAHPRPPFRRSPLAPPSTKETAVAPPAVVIEEDTPEARAEAEAVKERRLQRTCLALLERLHKHGHGSAQGYVKRVVHDTIIRREPFQDLYQELKERHKHLNSRVAQPWSTKVEDVKRHVWKSLEMDTGSPDDRLLPTNLSAWGSQDIAIAAFLMLLWKDMYPARDDAASSPTGMEWDRWGRPPGGFVDLGCGNGLLVHILVSEGYSGKGYELRERRTWPQYSDATRASLVELAIDMPSWFPETMEEWDSGVWPGQEACVVKEGTFLIGNHSDELTPWIPLLSLLPNTPSPYLSLPCCLHMLDDKFTKTVYDPPAHTHSPAGGFEDGLEPGASRYKAYTMWLGYQGLVCGWKWEKESLRIPSTRGWAIVARRRWTASKEEDRAARAWALDEVNGVRARGAFAVRAKEGKDH